MPLALSNNSNLCLNLALQKPANLSKLMYAVMILSNSAIPYEEKKRFNTRPATDINHFWVKSHFQVWIKRAQNNVFFNFCQKLMDKVQ